MQGEFDGDGYAGTIRDLAAPSLAAAGRAEDLAALMAELTGKAEADLALGLGRQGGEHIACAAGCGSCCVVNVAVLFPEAVAIAQHLQRLSASALAGVARRLAEALPTGQLARRPGADSATQSLCVSRCARLLQHLSGAPPVVPLDHLHRPGPLPRGDCHGGPG